MISVGIRIVLVAVLGIGGASSPPLVPVEAEPAFTLDGGGVSHDPVIAGVSAYIASSAGLTRVDLETGKVAWFVEGTSFQTPVILGDLVITAEWVGKSPDPKEGCVHAYDVKSGSEVWATRLNAWVQPAGADQSVAILSRTNDTYELSVLDAKTGSARFRIDVPDAGYAHPVVSGAYLMFATDARGLEVRSIDDGKLAWSTDASELSMGEPTCDGKRVYCLGSDGNEGVIRAFELDTGKVAWKCPLKAPSTGRLVIDGTRGFLLDWGGTITAIDIADGKVAWTAKFDRGGTRSVAVGDGIVFASVKVDAPNDKTHTRLVAVSAESGRVVRASQVFPNEKLTAPATGDGLVLAGSAVDQGHWYAWETTAFLLPDSASK